MDLEKKFPEKAAVIVGLDIVCFFANNKVFHHGVEFPRLCLTADNCEPDDVGVIGGGQDAGVVAGVLQDGALDGEHAHNVVVLPASPHPGGRTKTKGWVGLC